MLPVISDFLFDESPRIIRELTLLNAAHDVFLVLIDSAFAFELPALSAGWIDTVDVETGQARTISRSTAAGLAGKVREWQAEVARAAKDAGLDVVRVGLDQRQSDIALWSSWPSDGCGRRRTDGSELPHVESRDHWLLLSSTAAWAQGSAPSSLPPATRPDAAVAVPDPSAQRRTDGMVETDPIRCWWRTSAGAVRIGETFTLTLTCAVLDDEAVQVVPDESRLASAVVQLAPFEVVGGGHPTDLRSGARRFLQYHYSLRIISPDAIGNDVFLPAFDIAYRVNSRLPGNTAQQGREMTYVLPPHAVRVVSTVPEEAPDIRDSAALDFARLESLSFRAALLRILGWAFMALGGLMTLLALVALARRSTRKATAGARLMSDGAIASVAAAELADVERQAGASGWTEPLVERALAASRVAAAGALGVVVHQTTAARGATPPRPEKDGSLRTGGCHEAARRRCPRRPRPETLRGSLPGSPPRRRPAAGSNWRRCAARWRRSRRPCTARRHRSIARRWIRRSRRRSCSRAPPGPSSTHPCVSRGTGWLARRNRNSPHDRDREAQRPRGRARLDVGGPAVLGPAVLAPERSPPGARRSAGPDGAAPHRQVRDQASRRPPHGGAAGAAEDGPPVAALRHCPRPAAAVPRRPAVLLPGARRSVHRARQPRGLVSGPAHRPDDRRVHQHADAVHGRHAQQAQPDRGDVLHDGGRRRTLRAAAPREPVPRPHRPRRVRQPGVRRHAVHERLRQHPAEHLAHRRSGGVLAVPRSGHRDRGGRSTRASSCSRRSTFSTRPATSW